MLKKINIGPRLMLGFSGVMLLMLVNIGLAISSLHTLGGEVENILRSDWVKSDAAATVNARVAANARRTMELFFAGDEKAMAELRAHVDGNKKAITEALQTLDSLVVLPEGKALLARVKRSRADYVQSFSRVDKLLSEGQRDQALNLLKSETLPVLDALQGSVGELARFQAKLARERGTAIEADAETSSRIVIACGIAVAILGLLIAGWITRSITGPVAHAVEVVQNVAGGNLTSKIRTESQDEVGRLLGAMQTMQDNLSRIVTDVRDGSTAVLSASDQIAAGNLDLSSRTEEQASSLEETAASVEELTSTVRQNTDNARQANQLAASASQVAARGGEVVSQVVDTMGAINESSRRIADIIGVIEGIAFQTNILALNAAVEAARAGEQGRGFAVVAGEVRSLAQRSAAAAKEIKSLIDDSVARVDQGSDLVGQAGSTMGEIVQSVRRVTDLMAEITAATQEQSSGIEQVNQAVTQIDEVTQQNAALVEQASAAAQSMRDQASNLARAVSVFKLAPAIR
ncbi:Methyl-accepting chemotaxis protein I [Cupriavidus laharis]|uniref:Methyl-accepting chemotaxis protein I n=1 Tax=Cupriavidus laharis TaxID=151654 RepID=A0ABM8WKS1_9BURK|nr:methyl-accepting chemotaxis protein [Cupriavidus laharis]CAG9167753.1 Methyl-accepting chemotaxis protein I [Cupriavidus laharis]